ncbi:TonB-dependent receptor [Novosphingobium sediminicola]|uniref:Outer membrane receptor protein involved in Fe transport n=1 Tax=Novosphingobium sediminicola TaxID=563162 RepID=A0A7W6CGB1_9SPHN|nr:TonB-dependent receptor [Novosphingobium sediminicola]MBB3953798.1 outer membrane receptor protein involved in Fe transport [Novosphingobium sediminicola]
MCAAFCAATPAFAQTQTYALPAQPVETAIAAIAHRAHIQIVASQRLIRGKWARPVNGDFTVDEALARMLQDTGLTLRVIARRTYAIVPAPPTTPPLPPVETELPAHRPLHLSPPRTEPAFHRPEPMPMLSGSGIIVTGSRLIHTGSTPPTPTLILPAGEMLQAHPGGIIDALNTIPAISGSINTTSNVNTGGFNMLNLRGIGSLRGLILLDGRRIGPTQAQGQVDVDVIPQILLKRVDVVTGGASATYGSDAVSGVVNFISDTDFTGFKAEARGGISQYGDDAKAGLGAAWGARFASDKGHVEIGYEFSDNRGFLRASRPFLNNYASMVGLGTAAAPYSLAYGTTLNSASFGGLINSGPLAGLQFAQNGVLSTFQPGTPTTTAAVNIGGDGAYFQGSTAGSALTTHRSMARLDYAFSDGLKFHASAIFSAFKQSYTQQNPYFSRIAIGYNNAYLSGVQQPYQAIIAAQGAGESFQFSKLDLALPNYRYNALESYYNIDAGLEGRLGRFEWSVDGYRTLSTQTIRNNNGINLQRFWAAIDAVDAGGKTVCHAALSNPAYAGCVPLNLFGPSSEQAAAIAYISQPTMVNYRYVTNDVNASIKGRLFDLPAGPVKAVLVGEWRRLTYEVGSNAAPDDPMDCAGIEFNCLNTPYALRYMGDQNAPLPQVSQTVREIATELEVPLISGQPLIRSLSFNGAARYTHYDTSGSVGTWKLGLVWKVSDALTLRGTRSRDIRAPNLYDLFRPATISTTNYTDLHTNTSGIAIQLSQGNSDLRPEEADTLTLGGVIRPAFLPGLTLSVDYYSIQIDQAIVGIGAFQPATQAACENSGGTASVCALYIRPLPYSDTSPANYPTLLLAQTYNVASLSTQGMDIDARYEARIRDHPLTIRALITYQPTLRYNNGVAGVVDVGGAADGVGALPPIPDIKSTISLSYAPSDNWLIRLQNRYRGAMRQHGDSSLVFSTGPVRSTTYFDINVQHTINRWATAFINVQNLFNKAPAVFASTGGSTQMNYLGGFAQGDDIEGRHISFGIRTRF